MSAVRASAIAQAALLTLGFAFARVKPSSRDEAPALEKAMLAQDFIRQADAKYREKSYLKAGRLYAVMVDDSIDPPRAHYNAACSYGLAGNAPMAVQTSPLAGTQSSRVVPERYRSPEYGFEIAYPKGWDAYASYEDNLGRAPSGNGTPAYAGETRNLIRFEIEGPDQPHGGGGYFEDGAIIDLRITGTSGIVEDWRVSSSHPSTLMQSTPTDWVIRHSSFYSDDTAQRIIIQTNGFTGAVQTTCNGTHPCKLFAEAGGAYRKLPSGRVLLVSWDRMAGTNDFSYQKHLLVMLSSFELLK